MDGIGVEPEVGRQAPGSAAPPQVLGGRAMRPLNVGDVLDGMFRLLVRRWRTYVVAIGGILVPIGLAQAWAQRLSFGGRGMLDLFRDPAAAEAFFAGQGDNILGPALQYGIAALTAVFLTPLLTTVACAIASQTYHDLDPQPGAQLRRALGRYPAAWAAAVLGWLTAMLPVLPGAVLLGIGAGTSSAPLSVVGGLLLFVGLLAVPVVRIFFSLVYPLVVVERAGPVTALRRSARLVKPDFWRMLGLVLLTGLVITIISGVLGGPFNTLGTALGGVVQVVAIALGSVLAGIATTPLTGNARTLLYYDARIRREGYDLALRIDRLSAASAPIAGGPTG